MRRTSTLFLLLVAACNYDPNYGDGQFQCGPQGECPSSLRCGSDNLCHASVANLPDGGGTPDVRSATPMVTVSLTGGGMGRVISNPAGIDCGTQCTSNFPLNASVLLTPMPAASSVFNGWMGDCSGGNACTLNVDQAKAAQARFDLHGARRWVDQISFPGQDSIENVAVDPAGNVYVSGTVAPMAGGGSDMYVRKYSNNGTIAWSNLISTTSGEYAGGLAVDAQGNAYIGATILGFSGSNDWGGTTVTPDLFGNIVIARLRSSDGHVDWVKQFGGTSQDRPHALAVSGTTLYVAGETDSNPCTFGTFNLAASGGHMFLAKLDTATGTVSNAKDLPGNATVWHIAVNGADLALVGQFRSNMSIDGKGINVSTGAHSDVMVYDFATSNLVAQWAKGAGDTTGDDSAYSVAAMPGGGWVVTGAFYGNILFATSGTSIGSKGMADVFVVRYDAAGNHVWSFGYGGTGSDIGDAVAVDASGATLVAGRFAADITFGLFNLTGATNDIFLTRMSPGVTPTHEWATKYGGTAYDYPRDLALDAQGNPFLVAQWTGMTVVDGVALTAQDYDGFTLGVWR